MIRIRMKRGTGRQSIQSAVNAIAVKAGRSSCDFFVERTGPTIIVLSRNGAEARIKFDFIVNLRGIKSFSRLPDNYFGQKPELEKIYPNSGY